MKDKRLIWIFLIVSQFAFSQIRGVVKDSISGEPIPFVNIWVENETIGTTSEADGTFFLQASKYKNIVISVLGYERKTLKGTEISEVFLKPTTYDLREVVVLNKKQTKKVEIGNEENAIFNSENSPEINLLGQKAGSALFVGVKLENATLSGLQLQNPKFED